MIYLGGDYDRVMNGMSSYNSLLNLAQLDTMSVYLDLVVFPAKAFEIAVFED